MPTPPRWMQQVSPCHASSKAPSTRQLCHPMKTTRSTRQRRLLPEIAPRQEHRETMVSQWSPGQLERPETLQKPRRLKIPPAETQPRTRVMDRPSASPERLQASPQPVHRPMSTAVSHQMVPPAMHAAGPATDMCESVPTPATEMELACWEQMQPPTSVLDSFPATVRTHAPAPSDTSRTIPATARELVIETLDTSPRAPALAKTLVRPTKATSIPDPALGSALVSTTMKLLGQDLALAREPAPSAIAQLVTTPVWDHLRAKRAWV
mmetsp:Transcript_9543/g.25970  ORF Transcript_9543/g.25970 Transcript_9543/m.25970 type:complete len:266 (+) Transcript_9543:649-1446(+)